MTVFSFFLNNSNIINLIFIILGHQLKRENYKDYLIRARYFGSLFFNNYIIIIIIPIIYRVQMLLVLNDKDESQKGTLLLGYFNRCQRF